MLEQSRELSAVVEAEDSLSEVETLNTESSTSNTECKRLTTSELQVHRVQPSACLYSHALDCLGVHVLVFVSVDALAAGAPSRASCRLRGLMPR